MNKYNHSPYQKLMQTIIDKGVWVDNERTGKRCLTIINYDMEYDCSEGVLPLDTTRKSYWKAAVAEIIGYLRGYDNAEDFRKLGTPTWDMNANSEAWQSSMYCKGTDDMGKVYGAVARNWPVETPNINIAGSLDTIRMVIDDLSNGIDNRGEIITFWNPGAFHLGCLRPCMHSHHFSILDGTLYLNSTQRSCDVPLGLNFNQVQCAALLMLVAQITGLKAGTVYHKIVNAHIYEDQLEGVYEQLERKPYHSPTLELHPSIRSLKDIEDWVNPDSFKVHNYQHHLPINYPFSV